MNGTIIKRVLDKYGLEWAEFLTPEKGYRNQSHPVLLANGDIINVILHKSEPGALSLVKMADAVSGYLQGHGMLTRKIYEGSVFKFSTPYFTQYGAIYNYLPGETIPWEAYTQAHIKLLGESMSNLHHHLTGIPDARELPYVANEYFMINDHMRKYFSDAGVQNAMQKKLGIKLSPKSFLRNEKLLIACRDLPDQQALHMDFVRGNILFQEVNGTPVVSGILDFEKTAYGHPVFDIARTLAFLLVDCKYKTEAQIRKYFLVSGYNRRGLSQFYEMRLLEELLNVFLLHDFYKFLKHNPYEYLHENEHYIRTRQLLLSRHIVDRIDTR